MQQHNIVLLRDQSYEELINQGLSQLSAQIILKELISEDLQQNLIKLSKQKEIERIQDIITYLACQNIFTYPQFLNTEFNDEQINQLDIDFQAYKLAKQLPYISDKTSLPTFKVLEQKIQLDKSQITILILGQTGSGKSTFINMLSNFLLLENIDSQYRVKLIYEDIIKNSQSCTEKLQNYVLYSRKFNKVVNLIDTPGFGDTRGYKQDDKITIELQKLLTNDINQVDMICLVKKESDNRLDDQNKYVIGKIFELFGKDIMKNFQIIITHSQFYDEPDVIKLFEEEQDFSQIYQQISDPKYLQFEMNGKGVIYRQKNEKFETNWNNCKRLFDKICSLSPQCLLQTKEVLQCRQQLLTQLDNLALALNNNLNRMNLLQQHFQNMGQNKLQKFKEIYLKKEPIPDGSFITNCLICKVTCHYPCYIEHDQFKSKCYAMTDGACRICQLKCPWVQHINNNFRYEYHYNELEQEQRDSIYIVNEYQQLVSEFIKNQDQMISLHQQISQTALLPNSHIYIIGYIEFTIKYEQDTKKLGYEGRIDELQKIKYKIEQLQSNPSQTNKMLIAPLMDVLDDKYQLLKFQIAKSYFVKGQILNYH